MRVLVIGGISRSLLNFRGPLIRAMLDTGHEVWACAGDLREDVVETLKSWGVTFVRFHLARAGMRPWEDFKTFRDLQRLMGKVRPDAILAYTVKPVIYGGLAARVCGVEKFFPMITGLGYAFTPIASISHFAVAVAAKLLYRTVFFNSTGIFFQNPDDLSLFLNGGYVTRRKAYLINGSGVDLDHYDIQNNRVDGATLNFLMVARLIRDKGVREYAEAGRRIRAKYPVTRLRLAGGLDSNPSSVSQIELEAWQEEGLVDYLGFMNDIRPAYADCSVFVLPSFYREGLPRTILEAMATGRPIITTDAPGCRETVPVTERGKAQKARGEAVMEGENGFLVRVRDARALAEAMEMFVHRPDLIQMMGKRSREIAEEKFDVRKVNAVILKTMGLT